MNRYQRLRKQRTMEKERAERVRSERVGRKGPDKGRMTPHPTMRGCWIVRGGEATNEVESNTARI